MNSQFVISAQNIFKSFGKVEAVKGISLDIKPGEFVALLGPNGAGKTTLVEMIEGIQKPDKGEIKIKDKPWTRRNQQELNRLLGISLQETWFVEKLTVKETLSLFASFYGLGTDRVNEILHLIDLEEKQKSYTKNLSGGQKQRLALGISLINFPEIILLDEPTTGLDPNARRDIWNILLKLKNEKNTSLLLTTHYMEEAEFLCDRIIIIDHGKTLARGTMDELLKQCGYNEIIEISFNNHHFAGFEKLPGIQNIHNNDGFFSLEVDKITQTLPELIKLAESNNAEIKSLECRKLTLDDLFISMTGRHLTE